MASQSSAAAAVEPDFYTAAQGRSGIMAWLLTTDHKRIGLMYFAAMMVFFAVAVLFGFLMRLEMLTPARPSSSLRHTTRSSRCTGS